MYATIIIFIINDFDLKALTKFIEEHVKLWITITKLELNNLQNMGNRSRF
jgi:hypothetical protein